MKTSDSIERTRFDAPWSTGLKISTAIVTVLVAGVVTGRLIWFTTTANPPAVWIGVLPVILVPAVLLVTSLFAVRGYELKHDALYIQRPLWRTRIPLRGLREVRADSEAMRGAFRICGCGGFLCHAGWFASRKLGRFRACATDPKRAVVLRFQDRTWVVTPDDPERFISRIEKKASMAA